MSDNQWPLMHALMNVVIENPQDAAARSELIDFLIARGDEWDGAIVETLMTGEISPRFMPQEGKVSTVQKMIAADHALYLHYALRSGKPYRGLMYTDLLSLESDTPHIVGG